MDKAQCSCHAGRYGSRPCPVHFYMRRNPDNSVYKQYKLRRVTRGSGLNEDPDLQIRYEQNHMLTFEPATRLGSFQNNTQQLTRVFPFRYTKFQQTACSPSGTSPVNPIFCRCQDCHKKCRNVSAATQTSLPNCCLRKSKLCQEYRVHFCGQLEEIGKKFDQCEASGAESEHESRCAAVEQNTDSNRFPVEPAKGDVRSAAGDPTFCESNRDDVLEYQQIMNALSNVTSSEEIERACGAKVCGAVEAPACCNVGDVDVPRRLAPENDEDDDERPACCHTENPIANTTDDEKSDCQAKENLDGVLNVTLKAMDKIVTSLQKSYGTENTVDLPPNSDDDTKILADKLLKSQQQVDELKNEIQGLLRDLHCVLSKHAQNF